MVLQKRLEYGFNGYQVPPTPRAARSATRRVPSWKKTEDSNIISNNNNNNNNNNKQMCAFDLLATVAGKLLQEGGEKETESVKDSTIKIEQPNVENDPSHVNNICDQGSCNRSFFVSEIISQAPAIQDSNSGPSSGITVSDCSEKSKVDKVKVKVPFTVKADERNSKPITNEAPKPKPPVVHNIDNNNNNNVKFPFCKDNVNLVRNNDDDDDEKFCGVAPDPNKNFKQPPRIGDRRIRRFLASKYWKTGPKLNDDVNCDDDVYSNKKSCFKRQRSLKDYPFKKRRLYELDNFSNSDDVVDSEDKPSPPRKDPIENGFNLGVKPEGGMKTLGLLSKQNPAFQPRDSHVKLKIKSFRVPELFFELPKTATIGSLKRTVMEAVTSLLSGDLHVGVLLQGKKIRDDDKTLLQTGLHNKLDALGFTLEPNHLQNQSSLCPKDHSVQLTPDMPKPLIRYTPAPNVGNKLVVQPEVSHASPDTPMANFGGSVESEHDSAPSPPDLSMDHKSGPDSRALVMVPAMNSRALAAVPLRKCKRSEVAQRRIRRPFSVSEVEALVQAVEKLGTGRWRDVKLRAFDNAKHRTYVDLKDKWKTLVHTARISPQQRRGEPVPQQLLDRVLAAHAYWSHHQAKQQFKQPSHLETNRLV
ncbi:putative transcription factor MYB-HB-like family [Helianthus annuus]|uniref:Putative TRF-like 2 n=1 Tax=Helianthus annuus TaxID=4232 RepID=A0A251VEG6_HELAN|nr:telomere repeat-binding protein 5 [Helianthus annuus]KAF5821552.1 putative SANT/Myb domain, Homeobox-like domain superfamily, Ubiquitin-like domain superfamily [Helianthus annuus]KAJ0611207.1 putative transcription factor MYB-HB-like family [Helianthus annuus]KAJ0622175.1 putative transcription factor MYB-HB-like family [Helianthus annuus]KAJ0782822.1 putative transcription factor MYB-HB-like family [Helianthus annuus]KAJ0947480.1 putative transcription factor MYB-HB-like family [Helianthus